MKGTDVSIPQEVEAIVLDDVKDITKLKLKATELLVQVDVQNKTGLIIPKSIVNSSITKSRYTVIAIGKGVKEYEVGDVLLDFKDDTRSMRLINRKGVGYIVIDDYSVYFATTADNLEG